MAEDGTPPVEYTFMEQALVMKGNVLFEWSQFLAATDGEWRVLLDEAAELFRAAHCPEKDIRSALKAHTMASSLDLGPEPEPEVRTRPCLCCVCGVPSRSWSGVWMRSSQACKSEFISPPCFLLSSRMLKLVL